jgi:L-threonylcarbamoyladenylate synthase
LVVYPTDTVYGLGCDPFDDAAVARLFEAKARSEKPIPILCEDLKKAEELVDLSAFALRLAKEFWPGALTIVGPARVGLPFQVNQGSGEVGVRVPAHAFCHDLILACGGVLAGTSANLSGRPPCRTAREALKAMEGVVDLILDGGTCSGKESTVVRVRGNRTEVLRRGAIDLLGSHPREEEHMTQSFKSARNRGQGVEP